MAFDQRQRKALRAKLRFANVKTRVSNGATIHYIEGWQAIAEANRIFGPDNWDRETRTPECIWSDRGRGQASCFYSSKVRITVRAGDTTIVRDGIGTGFGRAATADAAHDIAMKAAETDATKRALATFGNPFGLALYDKEFRQVTRPTKPGSPAQKRKNDPSSSGPKVLLMGPEKRRQQFSNSRDLLAALEISLAELKTLEALYAFWEANLENFATVLEADPKQGRSAVDAITAQLKARARVLGRKTAPEDGKDAIEGSDGKKRKSKEALWERSPARSQSLPIAKERRVRDANHLGFVARHPCIVCGRRPAQAHHVRFAQPRAMSMKVSDEFTVPLCVGHHDSVHRTGDERAWWAARKIDPLAVALELWSATDKNAEFLVYTSEAESENSAGDNAQARPSNGKDG